MNNKIKLSIITVCFNSEETIEKCLKSVLSQKRSDIEHVIVDGQSTDNTCRIIERYLEHVNILFLSEPDEGIYDALNKAMGLCSGEIIGVLNSDDEYFDENVLTKIYSCFVEHKCDVLHGDLIYEKGNIPKRIWKSGDYIAGALELGWMPPHPTIFIRSKVLDLVGTYDSSYKISGDYEWIWRLYKNKALSTYYLPHFLVRMQVGGVSNDFKLSILKKYKEDFKIARLYSRLPLLCVLLKIIRKIPQFLRVKFSH